MATCWWFMVLLPLVLLVRRADAEAKIVDELQGSFSVKLHWIGLEYGLALQFSPYSDDVFVAEKNGRIRRYDHIDVKANEYHWVLDLSSETFIYHDRGMLGFALHPNFPRTPYMFAMYSVNKDPNTNKKLWDPPGECPMKRGICPTPGHLIRIKYDTKTKTGVVDQVLIDQFCGSSPSHHVDDLKFAPDGSLYISVGDGSPFDYMDIGEGDPCSDPKRPLPQGPFRSQWEDSVMGKIMRIPAENLLLDRMLTLGDDFHHVAIGARNPFRMVVKPDNGDLYFGDVGADDWEEINIIPNPLTTLNEPPPNYGWPCYEGPISAPVFRSYKSEHCAQLSMNKTVSAAYQYKHHVDLVQDKWAPMCSSQNASPTGLLFYNAENVDDQWKNVLFMAEGSMGCIYYFENNIDGEPDMSQIRTFMYTLQEPEDDIKDGQYVDMQQSRDGDIYIVDIYYGKLFKVSYNYPPGMAPPKKPRFQPSSASLPTISIMTTVAAIVVAALL